ncbi:DUF4306 domain-containing protein [Bacillus sp. 1P06AnD]|uniref:DUF4306 domain-containing protein n=1 Tax=Bacillus sp. 1P06AnD TaxID=3132208 RepID=UPI0039A068F6
MAKKSWIPFTIALTVFIFSLGFSLSIGSEIVNRPGEWQYTAQFTQKYIGTVNSGADISLIDYLVYAAKYEPIFPLLMYISGLYALTMAAYLILEKNKIRFSVFVGVFGIVLTALSTIFFDSPTLGGKVLSGFLLVSGIGYMAGASAFFYYQNGGRRMKHISSNS